MPIETRLGGSDEYSYYALTKYHTPAEVKAEYTRMRRILLDRVRRIEHSGEFPDSVIAQRVPDYLPPSRLNEAQMAQSLSDLYNELRRQRSSLTGLKEERTKIIETLQDRGYQNINKSNFRDFTRFMEATRSIAVSILRYKYVRINEQTSVATGEDRNKRLELFNMAQRKNISINSLIRDFRFYVEHIDELDKLPDRTTGRKLGSVSVRRRLGLK